MSGTGRICGFCGIKFEKKRGRKKYCSIKCRNQKDKASKISLSQIRAEFIKKNGPIDYGEYKTKEDKLIEAESAKRVKKYGEGFYSSREWIKVRYKVLSTYGRECMLCGDTGQMHVDHIKPRSKYPDLALDFDNLQVLCKSCNIGKMADDEKDFRPKKETKPEVKKEPEPTYYVDIF